VTPAVIRGREHSKELAASESLKAIHHTFMCAKNIFSFIVIKELFDPVRPELDNVSRAIRISDEVRLNTELGIIISGIAPKNVDDELLLWSGDLVDDLEWALDHFNLFDRNKR